MLQPPQRFPPFPSPPPSPSAPLSAARTGAAAPAVAPPASGGAAGGSATSGRFDVDVELQEVTSSATDFCGVPGLTVQTTFTLRRRGFFTYRGSSSTPSFTGTTHQVVTVVEPDGTTVTASEHHVDKDQHIVDNGDGTLTITGTSAGGFRVVGPLGQLRHPGMLRYRFVIDTAGTPLDPSNDRFVAD